MRDVTEALELFEELTEQQKKTFVDYIRSLQEND